MEDRGSWESFRFKKPTKTPRLVARIVRTINRTGMTMLFSLETINHNTGSVATASLVNVRQKFLSNVP